MIDSEFNKKIILMKIEGKIYFGAEKLKITFLYLEFFVYRLRQNIIGKYPGSTSK